MGHSYGIATKDRNIHTLPLMSIKTQINKFLVFALEHPDLKFLVTPIGCGLAGYKYREIASLFYFYKIPLNVIMPEEFKKYEMVIPKPK